MTPNLDRIARRGIRFAQCMATAPTTLASFTSMMSGLYPHTHGVARNSVPVPDQLEMLADRFRQRGYETAAFIASYPLRSDRNFNQGFDLYEETFQPELTGGPVQRRADNVNEALFSWLNTRPVGMNKSGA